MQRHIHMILLIDPIVEHGGLVHTAIRQVGLQVSLNTAAKNRSNDG
jgi:hypothetical protein